MLGQGCLGSQGPFQKDFEGVWGILVVAQALPAQILSCRCILASELRNLSAPYRVKILIIGTGWFRSRITKKGPIFPMVQEMGSFSLEMPFSGVVFRLRDPLFSTLGDLDPCKGRDGFLTQKM